MSNMCCVETSHPENSRILVLFSQFAGGAGARAADVRCPGADEVLPLGGATRPHRGNWVVRVV